MNRKQKTEEIASQAMFVVGLILIVVLIITSW